MNIPRIMYESKSIETDPLGREIMVHTAMHYQCEVCRTVFQFWLEKGLEDRKQDEIHPEKHKPVPFCIGCLCGGMAKHIAWGSDIRLDDYRPLESDENYFENAEDSDCGVSHFRNYGIGRTLRPEFPEIGDLVRSIEEEHKKIKRENREVCTRDFEDDPYGLAHISTTTLKSELRRRKRWK